LQPEHVSAPYLSAVKYFKSRKLISKFRCGCHGLHVDTGRLLPLAQQVPREQRRCFVCNCGSTQDEHHFMFACPAYCVIRNRFTNIFWGPAPTLSFFQPQKLHIYRTSGGAQTARRSQQSKERFSGYALPEYSLCILERAYSWRHHIYQGS